MLNLSKIDIFELATMAEFLDTLTPSQTPHLSPSPQATTVALEAISAHQTEHNEYASWPMRADMEVGARKIRSLSGRSCNPQGRKVFQYHPGMLQIYYCQ